MHILEYPSVISGEYFPKGSHIPFFCILCLRSLLRGAYAVPVFQSSGRTVKVSNLFHLCHSLSWSSLYVVPFPFVHGMTEITKEWKVSNRYYELNDEVVMTSPNENQATGPIIAVAAAMLIPPILRRPNKLSSKRTVNDHNKQRRQDYFRRLLTCV